MSKQEKSILMLDSRSENMVRRLLELPAMIRLRRQRRLLLGSSGCLVKATDWVS
ncbi:hypothetical protein QEH54_02860 [Pelagicoccus sp. SDUM812003]|nr:hypothetical protein [Pelagicoccus sp. SDUM812003]